MGVDSGLQAAMRRHPAGKGREPQYLCVICSGPTGGCECVAQLLWDRRIPYTTAGA